MSAPIFPQIIYPIGNLPDGKYYVVIAKIGFSYCKDLPDLSSEELPSLFEEDWEEDTEPHIHVDWEDSHPRINEALGQAS